MNIRLAMFKTVMAYVITEHLGGKANVVKVHYKDNLISISDNGRGHSVERNIDGIPYLDMVYCQLSLFDTNPDLNTFVYQALGMSLISEMCDQIKLTVANHGKIRNFGISNGIITKLSEYEDSECGSGNTIEYLAKEAIDEALAESDIFKTLQTVASKYSNLTVYFNDQLLSTVDDQ